MALAEGQEQGREAKKEPKMKKNFAIIRQIKIKGVEAFEGVAAEADRSIFAKNVDASRTEKNIVLKKSQYAKFADFVQKKKQEIRIGNLRRKKGEKKARFPRILTNKKTKEKEYPALSQQFVFSFSHGALSEKDGIEYLRRADEFIREWFEKNEIISSIIHRDETTDHIHIDVAYWNRFEKRFNQKELTQDKDQKGRGKTDISRIREAFQKEVANYFNLRKQDGSVVEKHDGKKADIGKGKLKEEIKELKNRKITQEEVLSLKTKFGENIVTIGEAIQTQTAENKTQVKEIEELKNKIGLLRGELGTKDAQIAAQGIRVAELERELEQKKVEEEKKSGDLSFEINQDNDDDDSYIKNTINKL